MRRTIAMAAVLAGLAAACTPGMVRPAADSTTAPSPAADTAFVAEAAPEPEPDVPALLRTAPLASVTHPLVHLDGMLEAQLRAEQVGDLVRLAVTFTPRGIDAGPTTLASLLGGSGTHEGISARLIDPVHLLEYETVRGGAPQGQAVPAHVDHPTTLVFYVAAPIEPLTSVDLLLDLESTTADWPGFVGVPFEAA